MKEADPVNAVIPAAAPPIGTRWRFGLSRAVLVLALLALAATFLLLSPPTHEGYPGAIPWADTSILRPLIDVLSLGGLVATVRGVEVKEFAFHLAVAAGLALLAVRAAVSGRWLLPGRAARGAWLSAQLLLVGWVALSAASSLWSGDPPISLGQAALYGLMVAWAIGLAWTLETRDVPHLLAGLVGISAIAAGLCAWYFFERNPFNRPGFPLGNPGALAASILPATLLCLAALAATRSWRAGDATIRNRRVPIIAAAALLPLIVCLFLTEARAALLGLVGGVLALLYCHAGRRMRTWLVAGSLTAVTLVGVWASYTRLDLTMSRGATVRFRLYAWRHASQLWQQQPVLGMGAGAYARLAGQLAIPDRILDPAAFLGDWTGHAHNELFEVLAEIGLVGGVTFVGGWLASLLGALRLLQSNLSAERRWLWSGLIAGIVALLVDSLASVGPRLPGVPAVLYTLLGALWAVCRQASPRDTLDPSPPRPRSAVLRRIVVAIAAGALSLSAAALACWNWLGVRAEARAYEAFDQSDYAAVLSAAAVAEQRLLDPVRRLYANERSVQAQFELAGAAHAEWRATQTASQPASSEDALRRTALQQAEAAYFAAARLDRRAPTLMDIAVVGARCAEMISDLYAGASPRESTEWRSLAFQAWRVHRSQDPLNVETLLALTRYPGTITDYIELLRDSLRSGDPGPAWQEALRHVAGRPGFDQALAALVRAAGPISPQTEINALIGSLAPETYRLSAAWLALRGDYTSAYLMVGRAVALYQPMLPRFPTLYPVALAEQAEYQFRADPAQAARSAELVAQAVAALPVIQAQKLEALARPFRMRLAGYRLAAGDEPGARRALERYLPTSAEQDAALADLYVWVSEKFIRIEPERRPAVEPWLRAALALRPAHLRAWSWLAWLAAQRDDAARVSQLLDEAARAGVPPGDLARMRASLAREFPASPAAPG